MAIHVLNNQSPITTFNSFVLTILHVHIMSFTVKYLSSFVETSLWKVPKITVVMKSSLGPSSYAMVSQLFDNNEPLKNDSFL